MPSLARNAPRSLAEIVRAVVLDVAGVHRVLHQGHSISGESGRCDSFLREARVGEPPVNRSHEAALDPFSDTVTAGSLQVAAMAPVGQLAPQESMRGKQRVVEQEPVCLLDDDQIGAAEMPKAWLPDRRLSIRVRRIHSVCGTPTVRRPEQSSEPSRALPARTLPSGRRYRAQADLRVSGRRECGSAAEPAGQWSHWSSRASPVGGGAAGNPFLLRKPSHEQGKLP